MRKNETNPSVKLQLEESHRVAKELQDLSDRLIRATEEAAQSLGIPLQGEQHRGNG